MSEATHTTSHSLTTEPEAKEFYKMQEIFEYKYHENLEELQM